MKKLFLFVALLTTLFSCKKNDSNGSGPVEADHFIFGVAGGLCGSCYHYYKVQNAKIYQDSGFDANWERTYSTVPLSQTKYDLASPLFTSFPNYLRDHPNATYGCSGCADQRVFYIEIVKEGVKTKWNVDEVPSAIPNEIRPYIAQMDNIINQLSQ